MPGSEVSWATEDLCAYQSIESDTVKNSVHLEKAHIMDREFCHYHFQIHDPSNMLALSPSMHDLFDGTSTHGVPRIKIRPAMGFNEPPPRVGGQGRMQVRIIITCRNANVFSFVESQLRPDTVRRNLDGATPMLVCSVWVMNPLGFASYLQWKHDRVTAW